MVLTKRKSAPAKCGLVRDLQKIPSEGQRACPEGERGGVSRYDKVFPVK